MTLRLALIGGGPGAFIGPVHRMAAELDGRIKLVAGVFSSDAERNKAAGAAYGVAPDRVHADVPALLAAEKRAIDLVAIATPNHLHFDAAAAALLAGVHVMSDKPATATLSEARALADIARTSTAQYGLTFTYAGYPMVREAREIVRAGKLGKIRKIVVEYSQGWLSEAIEASGQKQAAWRTDPKRAGLGGCIGDIGVHAFHIAEFVSGRRVDALCADLNSLVAGRALDDDCNILLRFDNGATGVLMASQIATGDRNGLRLRVWGDQGGLDWSHEAPDRLMLHLADGPSQTLYAGMGGLSAAATRTARLPVGHPEGFIEAFGTLYRDFAAAIQSGDKADRALVPGIEDGVRSMAFVETAVKGNRAGWVTLEGGLP